MKTSNYIQRFNFDIRHKLDKQYIVSDALFRLINDNINIFDHDGELNALFTVSLMKMNSDFKQRILNDYKSNFNWQRIFEQLDVNENNEIVVKLLFYRKKNDFIFRFDDFTIDDHVYELRRLCISHSIIKNILQLTHNEKKHLDYVKCFERLTFSWYIRGLSRYLRNYLKHCSKCQMYQIKRHASYESMQPILTSTISFHIITINFILTLSTFINDFDIIMNVSNKFIKRVQTILNKKTWTVAQWNMTLLNQLDIADWKLFKTIIFDKDRKFFFDMWSAIFKKLNVKFLYSIVFYFQIDEQFERMNQLLKITLRYHMITMKNLIEWSKMLLKIQRHINNSVFVTIDKSFNEVVYDFTSMQTVDLWKFVIVDEISRQSLIDEVTFFVVARARVKVADFIVFVQIKIKRHYDEKHKSMHMRESDYAFIKLHKKYDISFIAILKFKYSQQYVDFFRILKRVNRLIYRLNLSAHWKIHSILFIVQLKLTSSLHNDFFRRSKSDHSKSIFVKSDIVNVKFFEMNRFINRRQIKRRELKYLIRWRDYESENDQWKNFSKLNDVMKLVKNYENAMQKIVTLSDKLFIINVDIDQKKKSERFSKLSTTVFKSLTIIVDTSSTFNQKKKSERSSKLSTTIFKSLIIIDGSSTVVVSFSISSNITLTSAESFVSISIIVSTAFNSKFLTNIFSLVSAEQRLAVVIFFKQVFIDSIFSAVARKSFVLKWKLSTLENSKKMI